MAQTSDETDVTNSRGELSLAGHIGFSFFGPKDDITSTMISEGFDDQSQDFFGGEPIDHPRSNKRLVYEVDATYFFDSHRGFSLNAARADKFDISGFRGAEPYPTIFGDYLFLESDIKTIALSYTHRLKNRSHAFFLGPMYLAHRVENSAAFQNISKVNSKVGAYFGYSFLIIEKRIWAVSLKLSGRWAPKSEIGPFEVDSGSEYPASKVNVSGISIGLGAKLQTQIRH